MSAVGERTGTFPDTNEENWATAPAQDRGSGGYAEEMDMSPEPEDCFQDKNGARQYGKPHISHVLIHAYASSFFW